MVYGDDGCHTTALGWRMPLRAHQLQDREASGRCVAHGATVVVPDFETAAEALGLFGSPTGEIEYRIADARRREATGMKD